jgi:glycerol-3-phosphate dehydrogenase
MAFLSEAQEEIREAVWQKHKAEETSLIREIEQAQQILKDLQLKYKTFEERIMTEVETAIQLQVVVVVPSSDVSNTQVLQEPVTVVVVVPESNLDSVVAQMSALSIDNATKSKMKCSLCKGVGHNKRSCKANKN